MDNSNAKTTINCASTSPQCSCANDRVMISRSPRSYVNRMCRLTASRASRSYVSQVMLSNRRYSRGYRCRRVVSIALILTCDSWLSSTNSRQNLAHHFAVHVGETIVAALEAEGEPGVVDAEEVKNRRLEVEGAHGIFDDVGAEVVGGAVGDAALDAAARHPDRKTAAVMIAAEARLVEVALDEYRAAEFTAPDDQCVVEHAALLQIFDQ